MEFKYSIATLGLVLGSMFSGSVLAAVTITAPEEIVILAVNDQEVNTGLFRTKQNEYKVDAGQVALSVRYQQYFEHLDGEHDILKSGVITIKAPDLKDGHTYHLSLVNAPRSFDEAKSYVTQPIVAIYDRDNKLIVEQTGANTEAKPWLSSGVFSKVVDLTSPKKTPIDQPAPVYISNAAATTTVKNSVNQSNVPVQNTYTNTADEQMIKIWQKASKIERQKFMSWLAEQ